jgi:dinuclear metal center YbgI/SA1388 family protein
MKIETIISQLESWAPPHLQESYDNSGLIVGNPLAEITSAIICLDSTEAVVDEAISIGANLIIAHHPIVFGGIKRFTGEDYVQKAIIKAIKNDIAIYAIHTNLDHVINGVNAEFANRLGLENQKILVEKPNLLMSLVTYVPKSYAQQVRTALFEAGAGKIGNYDNCSFNSEGLGTYRAIEGANPFIGEIGENHIELEERIEIVAYKWLEKSLLKALRKSHPYEEIAYQITTLYNSTSQFGAGMIGELKEAIPFDQFLIKVKTIFGGMVRYTESSKSEVKKIALCGGSGSFLLKNAIQQDADVYLSADFKYHQFFDSNGNISIVDIGHFESEQFTMNLILRYLMEKNINFAARLTSIQTNPIKYL